MVLRTGSFSEAARELGYTASAVSQQISALERATRTPLFEREAHGVQPTPAAAWLGERADQALGQLRALEDDLALRQNGTIGRLRLGSFPSASERLLPLAVSHLRRTHPGLAISLDEGEPTELFAKLASRELDAAVIYRYGQVPTPIPTGLRAERLFRESLVLLAPPRHRLGGGGRSEEPVGEEELARLGGESWISTGPGTSGASTLRRLCARAGFEPDIVHRSNNYTVVHGLVAAGLGLAIVPRLGHQATRGVVGRRVEMENAYREVLAVGAPVVADGAWSAAVSALRLAAGDLAEPLTSGPQ
ncbi:LysR family transcriptional regulator [Nocardioides sp. CBS4Y-1]|uniref:LysR family transcriptional regulator n=2 Tax=Nocardioides acrostichi TaxID=2784339 RepID=A0A930UZ77_9ACTN|nr:LysR family transcriptional regulator [Nocardioides acrostichi]